MPNDDAPRAPAPGTLPTDFERVVGDIQLPSGTLITPDPAHSPRPTADGAPVLWMTDDVVPGAAALWSSLRRQFPTTGLWPVLLDTLSGDPERPWKDGELEPQPLEVLDIEDVAGEHSAAWTVEHEMFCSDNLWQGLGSYADGLVDTPAWPFWWD